MNNLFYLFVLLFLAACNQSTTHTPMLWEITGKDSKVSSYIFGTYHTKDPQLNVLPKCVTAALKTSQRLYTEIPMNDLSTKEVIAFSKMPHPTPIEKRLHPSTGKLLREYLQKHKLSYTFQSLKPFKTWAVALMLTNQKENTKHPHTLFMDEQIVEIAKTAHIGQFALETPIEQLKYFDMLSDADQEQLLLDIITQGDDAGYAKALKIWYSKGGEEGFYALQEKYASQDPVQLKLDTLLMQGLLTERNFRFTKRIHTLLKNNPDVPYFFAIGAGHMSGEKGILSSLRQQGYLIKKM